MKECQKKEVISEGKCCHLLTACIFLNYSYFFNLMRNNFRSGRQRLNVFNIYLSLSTKVTILLSSYCLDVIGAANDLRHIEATDIDFVLLLVELLNCIWLLIIGFISYSAITFKGGSSCVMFSRRLTLVVNMMGGDIFLFSSHSVCLSFDVAFGLALALMSLTN